MAMTMAAKSSSLGSLPFLPPRLRHIHPLPPRLSFLSSPPRLAPLTLCSAAQRSTVELNEGIAQFYDSSSAVWEDIWGEHMHHGFYDPDLALPAALFADHTQAQIRMIEETLSWAGIPEDGQSKPQKIVDVGCGIGGSSRHMARKYGASVVGITLSPNQAKRATEITSSAGLVQKVSFQIADALNQPFPDEQFDLVWSMESGEHMPDKQKFVSELARVTKPGGRMIIVTWCHRELLPEEKSLKPSEQELLDKICDAYYLPAWCATSEYVKLAQSMQLQECTSSCLLQDSRLVAPSFGLWASPCCGLRDSFRIFLSPSAGRHESCKGGWHTITQCTLYFIKNKPYIVYRF